MAVVVLMIFASLAIDVGMLRNNRQILANAVDSAALAGGTLMPVDGSAPGATAAVTTLINKTMAANYPGIVHLPVPRQLQVPRRHRHEHPAPAVHRP